MTTLTITRPDDWHLHVRDGAVLNDIVPHTARHFARAIIMPNLKPPITTTEQALAYRSRIQAALPPGSSFEPLMTLYLTDHSQPDEIRRARQSGQVLACKLYPAGATTNSASGVTDIARIYPVLEAMQTESMPLLVHGEVTDSAIDLFDREAVFIKQILQPLTDRFPDLKIVLEHITTRQGVEFVQQSSNRVAGTLTAHHLLYNRNALFSGGLRPHYYCLPVLKREEHRQALLDAATSGSPKFFLGTDSAPHPRSGKETACGCAGCYTAPLAMALYAEAFEQANALDRLEGFASFHGADFYGLPRNRDTLTLEKTPYPVPDSLPFGDQTLIPLRAGETLPWQVTA